MDEGEGGRKTLDFDEKNFLFEWLVENNKTLTRKNKELLVENLKLRSRVEELEKISFIDPTTGLYNRWYLQPRLVEEFSRAKRRGFPLSCLFIDIDDFNAVNDRHGHFIGDRVLRDMAQLLRGHCRKEDVLIRFGGDEFVMLLSASGQRAARAAAERIRGRIRALPLSGVDPQPALSVSIGVSTLGKEHVTSSRDPWELVWTADGAMHLARQKGPGRIHWLDCHDNRGKADHGERAVS
ncbi:MAG TPA: GGDEF domain-containing protein [Syntrophales bacterium]|nr:GGDEF domain-containing protein [Syntrophales bacterium]